MTTSPVSSRNGAQNTDDMKAFLLHNLTRQEIKILILVANGYSNKEIGTRLYISEYTVKKHRQNICVKCRVKGAVAFRRFVLEHSSVIKSLHNTTYLLLK